jgi:allophanate hydrolase
VLSTLGVVPACRSLDCVSVFARSPADARAVFDVAQGVAERDPYGRAWQPLLDTHGVCARPAPPLGQLRFGVPRADQLEFYGDASYRAAWDAALARLRATGARVVEIDFGPFLSAARLLYGGLRVAERVAAIGAFAARQPDALHPVIREILGGASRFSAADAFAAFDQLRRCASTRLPREGLDAIAMPTSPTTATVDALEADPIAINSRFGYYTNFVNLLDLSAIAVPAGACETGPHAGLPFGITFVGRAHDDARLLDLAQAWGDGVGHADGAVAAASAAASTGASMAANRACAGFVRVAVVGAHLRGEPLNGELTQRGALRRRDHDRARLSPVRAVRRDQRRRRETGPRARAAGGAPIAVEVWEMPVDAYGSFVAGIAAPLGIGTLTLADGATVQGFVCESAALDDAQDITRFGGWRAYRAQAASRALQ